MLSVLLIGSEILNMSEFFQWTTRAGVTTRSINAPTPDLSDFEEINELVLLRPSGYFEYERMKLVAAKGSIGLSEFAVFKNQPIPCHNSFCLNGEMPPNLTIFRANDCRIWHWPKFPPTIVEIEMKNACIQTIPDLSALSACTILMLDDGIIEDCVGPLPPRLEVLGLASCAVSKWTIGTAIPETLGHIFFEGNPSRSMACVPLDIQRRFVRQQRQEQPRFMHVDGLLPVRNNENIVRGPNIAANLQNVHESGFQESTKNNIQLLIRYRLQRLRPMSKETHGQVIKTAMGRLGTLIDLPSGESVWSRYLKWLDKVTTSINGTIPESALGVKEYFVANPTAQEVFEYFEKSTIGEKLLQFMQIPYSLFGTTFFEIAVRVVEKILDIDPNGTPEEKEKRCSLFQRLKEEVEDGYNHCLNGMIVRLTNVFIGLDDAFEMTASPATVLGGRIPVLLEKLRKDGGWKEDEEPSVYWKQVIEEIIKDMREMDMEKTKWNNWISDFVDEYKEALKKEGKIKTDRIIRMDETELKNLEIRELFFEDQIRIWVGLGDFK